MKWFKLEPAAVGTAAAAVYVAVAMIYRAFVAHDGVFEPDLAVAAVLAVWGLFTRAKVTPLAAPKDAQGRELAARQPTRM